MCRACCAQVLAFDGQAMVERRGGRIQQRKLKDVVRPADTHTLRVERARALPGLPPPASV